jgi:ribosomal protein S18 acetylase RimI-like enzyme
MTIQIARLTKATGAEVEQFNALIPQLKPAWPPVTGRDLERLLESPTRVYVARRAGAVVGVCLLVPHRHIPGLRYHIEDVVVDEPFRRQGIARALLSDAMSDAPGEVLSYDLRSHHSRCEAHALYRRLGFEPSETTVFRRPVPPTR